MAIKFSNPFKKKTPTKVGDVGNIQTGTGAPSEKVYYNPSDVAKAKIGDTIIPASQGGGVISGGGGGSSGGSSQVNAQAEANRIAQEKAQAQAIAEQQRQEKIKAQQELIATKRQQNIEFRKLQEQKARERIIVEASGGVRIGSSKFVGNAFIPEVNMTANEYSRKIRQDAINQGIIDKKDYGLATLTITRDTSAETTRAESKPITIPSYNGMVVPLPTTNSNSITGWSLSSSGQGEVYDSRMGMFVKKGTFGTVQITRPPTFEEQEQFKARDIKAGAIVAVPGQYVGSIFDKEISSTLIDEASQGNFLQRFGTFLNPKFQYKVAVEQEQLKQDILTQREVSKNVDKYYQSLLASGIKEDELKSGNITSELSLKQINALNNYNSVVEYALDEPSTKRMQQPRTDFLTGIAGSDSSEFKKGVASFSVRAVQIVPSVVSPPVRLIMGLDVARAGASNLELAETKGEKYMAGGQIALGGLLAISGGKGTYNKLFNSGATATATTITGSATKLKLIKYGTYAGGTLIGGGVGVLDYISTFKKTGSRSVALGASLGSGGTIIASLYAPAVYQKASDIWRTRNLVEIKTPDVGAKPFIRSTKGGTLQEVFYARAEKVKWYNPSSWKYSGMKPGQFLKRQYRLVDPLVEANFKGLNKVTYFDIVKGKVVQRTSASTTFPYDSPSRQKAWFMGNQGGVQRYYLPKKFLPSNVKDSAKGFGFSATNQKWVEGNKLLEDYQVYYSGKGVSAYFFRMGGESQALQFGGGGQALTGKPVLYGGFFEKVKVNRGVETVVPNPLDAGGKGWKQYLFGSPTQKGVLNLPLFKREVEGVVTGGRQQLGQFFKFSFGGRSIPIDFGAYWSQGTLSQMNVPASSLVKSSSSYIPTTSYVANPSTSILSSLSSIKYSPPSKDFSLSSISYSSPTSSSKGVYSISAISSPTRSSASRVSSSVSPKSSVASISSIMNYNYSPVKISYKPQKYSYRTPNYYKAPTPVYKSTTAKYPFGFKQKPFKQPKQPRGSFLVSLRRFGKFKTVGKAESLGQAFGIGVRSARAGLGRTFKVEGAKTLLQTPKGFYSKKTKKGEVVFIQKSIKGSLGTFGSIEERRELQSTKRRKRK